MTMAEIKPRWVYIFIAIGIIVIAISCYYANDRGQTFITGVGALGQVGIAVALYFLAQDQTGIAREQKDLTREQKELAWEQKHQTQEYQEWQKGLVEAGQRDALEKHGQRLRGFGLGLRKDLLSFFYENDDRQALTNAVLSELHELADKHEPEVTAYATKLRTTMLNVIELKDAQGSKSEKDALNIFVGSSNNLLEFLGADPLFRNKKNAA